MVLPCASFTARTVHNKIIPGKDDTSQYGTGKLSHSTQSLLTMIVLLCVYRYSSDVRLMTRVLSLLDVLLFLDTCDYLAPVELPPASSAVGFTFCYPTSCRPIL